MEATAVGLTAILSITPSVIMLLCRSTGFRNLSIWKKSRHTIASYHRVIPSRHTIASFGAIATDSRRKEKAGEGIPSGSGNVDVAVSTTANQP